MIDNKQIGDKIRAIRLARGLTQNEFAVLIRVTPQAVSNWERGVTPPDIDNIIRISDALGVTADYLLRQSNEECYIAIDGGGTKTEFVVFNAEGHIFDRFVLMASNPNDIGLEHAFQVISSGIDKCLVSNSGVVAIFGAVAGITAGDNKPEMLKMLKKKYHNIDVFLETDAICNLALDKSCTMSLICGTGSVLFVRTDGEPIRVGGWGYLFDGLGSAYDIGRDAIRAALEELDGFSERTLVSELVIERLGGNIWNKLPQIYEGGKPFIASFAPVVFEALAQGDKAAEVIINSNVRHLASLIERAASRFGVKRRVMASGGLFTSYRQIMKERLSEYTDAELVFSSLPPIFGACRRCLELLSVKEKDEFFENFENNYGKFSGGIKTEK